MKFSKKDFWSCVITGLYTGLIGWLIADFLNYSLPRAIPLWSLMILFPVLWLAGVNLGYALGRWIGFFNQFGKFATIGFTNFAVDSGVLYLLISQTGIAAGAWYSVFKTLSFIVGVTHSYLWNKHWVFEAGRSGGGRAEAVKFFGVMILSAAVNVLVASPIVNAVPAPAGMPAASWAGVGAVIGAGAALVFSFAGFRVAVFKHK